MMNTNPNPASVGRRVRRSKPNLRSSAGTQPSSGSNLGAEAAEDPSAPGSGISAQPSYPLLRQRLNGAAVREARAERPGINNRHIRGFGSRSTDHLLGSEFMTIDRMALAAGSIRLASGISFLIDPLRANRLWGDPDKPTPTAQLLLRSMGYRDALIGGLLATAALRGNNTRGWFLASAGADAADLLGGMSVHHEMKRSQQLIGLGGAVIGVGTGLLGAARRTTGP